jgi:hypothetical protein
MSERRGSEGTQEVPGATHDNCSTQGKHVRPPSARHASPSACRRSRRRAAGRRAPELAAGVKMRQERTARTSPLLPGRIASGGYRRADPAVRQGARADDAGRRGAARSRAASADVGHPEVIAGATAPRACRPRVGIPVKWPRAGVPRCGSLRAARIPIRPRRSRRRTAGTGTAVGPREARDATQPWQPLMAAAPPNRRSRKLTGLGKSASVGRSTFQSRSRITAIRPGNSPPEGSY